MTSEATTYKATTNRLKLSPLCFEALGNMKWYIQEVHSKLDQAASLDESAEKYKGKPLETSAKMQAEKLRTEAAADWKYIQEMCSRFPEFSMDETV